MRPRWPDCVELPRPPAQFEAMDPEADTVGVSCGSEISARADRPCATSSSESLTVKRPFRFAPDPVIQSGVPTSRKRTKFFAAACLHNCAGLS
jgi:hypothetical protein